MLPKRIGNWSLTSLQQRLVKTGGRPITRARYFWPLLAEGHLRRRLFGGMLRRIAALPAPAGPTKTEVARKAVREELRSRQVAVESATRAAVAGHGVHGRSRTILSGLRAGHSGEEEEP